MNQVALVTGASNGIDEAIVNTLLKNEYNLLGNGRTINSTFTLQPNLILNNEDLLMPQTAQILLNAVLQQWQRCDLLFVDAGTIESANIETIDIDKMCNMVRLKVEMSYRIIYTFLKYFKKMNRGHIIIASSVMGTKTRENSGAYAGCNFALEALAESLRMELSDTK